MKKRLFFVLATLAAVLAFVGCAGGPPKLKTSGDCLIVVKSDFIQNAKLSAGSQASRDFEFVFSGDYAPVDVKRDYTMFVVKEPAVMVSKIRGKLRPGWVGKPYVITCAKILPYEPGRVVVADFVFEVRAEKDKMENWYYQKVTLRNTKDQEREEMLEKFRADPAFASWVK